MVGSWKIIHFLLKWSLFRWHVNFFGGKCSWCFFGACKIWFLWLYIDWFHQTELYVLTIYGYEFGDFEINNFRSMIMICDRIWSKQNHLLTGWWQLKDFFIFTTIWGRWTHFDEHIFQLGWFNHQLVVDFCQFGHVSPWPFPPSDLGWSWDQVFLLELFQGHLDCYGPLEPKVHFEGRTRYNMISSLSLGNHIRYI